MTFQRKITFGVAAVAAVIVVTGWFTFARAVESPPGEISQPAACCGGDVGCPEGVCCARTIAGEPGCDPSSCSSSDCWYHHNVLTRFYGTGSGCRTGGVCVGYYGHHLTCVKVRCCTWEDDECVPGGSCTADDPDCENPCTAMGQEIQIVKPTPVALGPCPMMME